MMEALSNKDGTGAGTVRCATCGRELPVGADGIPLDCPDCAKREFTQSSSLRTAQTSVIEIPGEEPVSDWLTELHDELTEAGQYLAYRTPAGEVKCFQLQREWTRIGRSLAADVRFDDPTVSRRHALIVRQADGLRVLDDRSLNGVFVNGERVEWSTLADGDEIVIGRHHLHFLEIPVVSGMRPAAVSGTE
jgi:predicted RNA-binding Zn-ribbon protein involved in translation (DUF1610 family)